ncbi:hypothetical protein [Novosphingobium sp. Leaf2]|uniref:hypothetical protein n=1 Tax=Novosphingobium sp. Leaf2 TaxID=1735670 RepID=UPI0012E31BE2|nr:hypothetical protein [Novosphingobium sp. Leaf2]
MAVGSPAPPGPVAPSAQTGLGLSGSARSPRAPAVLRAAMTSGTQRHVRIGNLRLNPLRQQTICSSNALLCAEEFLLPPSKTYKAGSGIFDRNFVIAESEKINNKSDDLKVNTKNI